MKTNQCRKFLLIALDMMLAIRPLHLRYGGLRRPPRGDANSVDQVSDHAVVIVNCALECHNKTPPPH
jgi:hypothetical protein